VIIDLPARIEPAEHLGKVHFIGIGGAALSGLARIMAERGVRVSGSDAKDSALLGGLRALGVQCYVGHRAEHVDGVDTVVVSTAIASDNPEVVRAYERGLRVWPRAAAVQSVLLGRTAVVVTGTHGKTTTTSMLTTALLACGADPSYAIGSTLTTSGLNAAAGSGSIFVAEGDESDGAILAYTPYGAVVTNIEADHLDYFGDAENYRRVFDAFLERIDPDGFLICCVDDPGAARLADVADELGLRVVRVGVGEGVDLRAGRVTFAGTTSGYQVRRGDELLGSVALRVPGTNYVVDSLAALAAGMELGFDFAELADGLGGFEGSGRRMEFKGEARGVAVYDSYAHHPTEIAGDIQAARALVGNGRLVVCFQPHLFSRTRVFGAAMGQALGAADEVIVLDVYPARELPEPGIDGSLVAAAVPLPPERVHFEPDRRAAAAAVVARVHPGDVVLTLGAGDVTDVGPQVLELEATGDSP
jgi:UDP-N-acetylmuramate--alanine ligase